MKSARTRPDEIVAPTLRMSATGQNEATCRCLWPVCPAHGLFSEPHLKVGPTRAGRSPYIELLEGLRQRWTEILLVTALVVGFALLLGAILIPIEREAHSCEEYAQTVSNARARVHSVMFHVGLHEQPIEIT
jgi:hypothetical protein